MIRMPYGLCNSQATYQRIMDKALRGVKHTDSYRDDILAHSPRFDSHLETLRRIFVRLRDAGIQLRSDKCSFGFQEVRSYYHPKWT